MSMRFNKQALQRDIAAAGNDLKRLRKIAQAVIDLRSRATWELSTTSPIALTARRRFKPNRGLDESADDS